MESIGLITDFYFVFGFGCHCI